jgi:hypothetical protein
MSPPGAFKPPGTVVRRRSEITEAKARVARLPRAAWLAKIQEAENWAPAREAAVATVPYHGPPHLPPTIETELSITWKDDIWMPQHGQRAERRTDAPLGRRAGVSRSAHASTASSQTPAASTAADSSITIERPMARSACSVEALAAACRPSR